MISRITSLMMDNTILAAINNTQNSLETDTVELASGNKIETPDQDPFGSAQVMSLDDEIARNKSYQQTIAQAQGMVSAASDSVTNIIQIVQRVQELVVQAGGGDTSATDMQNIESEVNQLTDAIKSQANATYGGLYIFSGTKTNTAPYALGGPPYNDNYLGDNGNVTMEVGQGVQLNVNVTGQSIIGDGTTGLIADLRTVSNDLQTNNGAALTSSDLTNLQNDVQTLTSQAGVLGATSNRLDAASNQLTLLYGELQQNLSDVDGADIAQVTTDYNLKQTALQAALTAAAKIEPLSLVNFLQ